MIIQIVKWIVILLISFLGSFNISFSEPKNSTQLDKTHSKLIDSQNVSIKVDINANSDFMCLGTIGQNHIYSSYERLKYNNNYDIQVDPILFDDDMTSGINFLLNKIYASNSKYSLKNISIDYENNSVSFSTKCVFLMPCEYYNSYGYRDAHYHPSNSLQAGLIDAKFSNEKDKVKLSKEAIVKLKFPVDIKTIFIDISNLKELLNDILIIDEKKSMRGIFSNNINFELNNKLLYSKIVLSNNMQIAKSLSALREVNITHFNFLKTNLLSGRIYNFKDRNITNYLPPNYFLSELNDLNYWIENYEYNWDFASPIENIIKENELAFLDVHNFSESIDKIENYEINIKWRTSLNGELNLYKSKLLFDYHDKKLKFENGHSINSISIDDQTNRNQIIIEEYLINPLFENTNNCTIEPSISINNKSHFISDEKYITNNIFDITKLIQINEFDWSSDIKNSIFHNDDYSFDLDDAFNNPSDYLANKEFISYLTTFNYSKIMYFADYKVAIQGHDSNIFNSQIVDNYIYDFSFKCSDYTSQIEVVINFKNIDAFGTLINDIFIQKNYSINLIPEKENTLIFMNSLDNEIEGFNFENLSKDELINNHILFNGSHYETNRFLFATNLNKNDWIKYALIDINISKFENQISVEIFYWNSTNYQNRESKFINNSFGIESFKEDTTVEEQENSALIIGLCISFCLCILSFLVFYFLKIKKNKSKKNHHSKYYNDFLKIIN
ncbi:MAG: hypothetical protein ACRC42_04275 [Mycoplasma sp.]